MNEEIQACVQCLGCYNEGRLNFKWVNAEYIQENIQDLNPCKRADHEEYMMVDTNFGMIQKMGEFPDWEVVAQVMELIEEHGDPFEIWFSHSNTDHLDVSELTDRFMEEYCGEMSEKEYAEQWLEDMYNLDDLPYEITSNINYEGVWIDLRNGEHWSQNTGSPNYNTHIFERRY